jgi:flagellar biosynthetic protein FliR
MALPLLYEWMMLFTRAGGLIALLPAISAAPVPMQVRIAIAGFLACAAMGYVHGMAAPPADVGSLVIIIVHELLIGLLMGFGARLIFYAVEFAGQLMSTEMGMTLSTHLDPITRGSTTAVGTLVYYLAIVLFFASDTHHAVIAAFMRSFSVAPVGVPVFTHNVAEFFVVQTGNIFLVAMQMAAPLMAVNFSVTFTFAVLGKAAPGLSVFTESFAVRILAGLTLLGLTLGLTAQIVLSHLRESPELMLRMIP